MRNNVVFLPDWSHGNPYQNLLANALERQRVSISIQDYPNCVFSLQRVINLNPACAVLHLHWINSLVDPIVWCGNPMKRSIKKLCLALDIILARIRGKHVVWTIHNLVSHESKNPQRELESRRIVAKMCSHVFVHSQSALQLVQKVYRVSLARKATIAPHGNYDGCYPIVPGMEQALRNKFGIPPEAIVILFFGGIRPYKGVERLLKVFKIVDSENLRLLIAGGVSDNALAQTIVSASQNDPRIIPAIGFVPDDQVSAFFSLSDVVALPFERTLTSGSAALACTMGKALLVPEDARVFDFVNDNNALFFDSEEQLTECLKSLDKTELSAKGRRAREAVGDFSWDRIAVRVASVYTQLVDLSE